MQAQILKTFLLFFFFFEVYRAEWQAALKYFCKHLPLLKLHSGAAARSYFIFYGHTITCFIPCLYHMTLSAFPSPSAALTISTIYDFFLLFFLPCLYVLSEMSLSGPVFALPEFRVYGHFIIIYLPYCFNIRKYLWIFSLPVQYFCLYIIF